jgi:nicotinamide riboside kinase
VPAHSAHGPRRIGLLGGECTGKSTLARALAEALPGCVVDEELRAFVDREGRPPTRDEQAGVLADQADREDTLARTCRHPWLVTDPAPLMTAVYSVQYFDDPTLLPAAVEHARGYALLVWCRPDLPWVADGPHRDGEQQRARTDALIDDLVTSTLTPGGLTVVPVTGDPAARVLAVLRAWQP